MYLRRRRGFSGIVQDISAAIKRQENVAPQYHNPGGLIAAPGCTSRPGQIAICPDDVTGEAGLERQVQLYIDRGFNLSDMINKWAPASCPGSLCTGNNPSVYTQHVAEWTGIDPSIPLNQVSGASPTADVSSPDPGVSSDVVSSVSDVLASDFFSGGGVSPLVIGVAAGLAILAVVVMIELSS